VKGEATIRIFETTYFRWPYPVVKRPPGTLTIQRLAEDRFILGTPAQCVEQITRLQQQLGLTHRICRLSFPGIPRQAALASVELFTQAVLPALRQA
jgi:alkanesulfonate monooxygenase SsuD/methylene tetrahydromethanopterin reductase-like flavin-dependent oxidoreductase (luciferase family)